MPIYIRKCCRSALKVYTLHRLRRIVLVTTVLELRSLLQSTVVLGPIRLRAYAVILEMTCVLRTWCCLLMGHSRCSDWVWFTNWRQCTCFCLTAYFTPANLSYRYNDAPCYVFLLVHFPAPPASNHGTNASPIECPDRGICQSWKIDMKLLLRSTSCYELTDLQLLP